MLHPVNLKTALRLGSDTRLAVVGAGGKTTLIFRLARDYGGPVIVTASTHLAIEQASWADRHVIVPDWSELQPLLQQPIEGVTLLTGEPGSDQRLAGLPYNLLEEIAIRAGELQLPVLVEADGSRRLPLKAPADHEPPIPAWANHVVVVAGLNGLGQPIGPAAVHRPEIFARLSQMQPGETVTPQALVRVLSDPQGGLKNIPSLARRSVVLNQADDDQRQAAAGNMARALLKVYDDVLVTRLLDPENALKGYFAPVAGIILAAGESRRMGDTPKVLLDWQGQPFVRNVAQTALHAGLEPVVVVTGSHEEQVSQALAGLPVTLAHNPDWQAGQSTSLRRGLQALPERTGAALFLLADQPQLTANLVTALIEAYRHKPNPIVAPLVEGRRANPVLFDRSTFALLMQLEGDVGGRVIFSKYNVDYLPWHDALLALDVDTPEDYQRLKKAYASRFET